ncbi:3'(2'),5'-bisphosphate nucleotidase CysQ, partial [Endozoicomonas sp. ONNA1]|uniref:3'(2'),5'-bisphosphate nucleotidase CysQ family protein n=1 Tax=Endozoicomonas sp. ONNA1 TaxID=2828740 RepID=UPI002147318E
MRYDTILSDVLKVADEASERVLHIYQSDFKVSFKGDESPITAADIASHEVIVRGLRNISSDIPILSEEGQEIPWDERRHWLRFWLIDPVDGTKDFTQRTGEFTVNIALIERGTPVLGVVIAPALKEAFWGAVGQGAFKRDLSGRVHRINVVNPRGEVKRVVASKN